MYGIAAPVTQRIFFFFYHIFSHIKHTESSRISQVDCIFKKNMTWMIISGRKDNVKGLDNMP